MSECAWLGACVRACACASCTLYLHCLATIIWWLGLTMLIFVFSVTDESWSNRLCESDLDTIYISV